MELTPAEMEAVALAARRRLGAIREQVEKDTAGLSGGRYSVISEASGRKAVEDVLAAIDQAKKSLERGAK